MSRFVIAALLLVLAACTTTTVDTNVMVTRPAAPASLAAATLAPVDSWEWATAPLYTRLVMLRQVATHRLQQGRITVATAREVQARADDVRTLLEASLAADQRQDRAAAASLADSARTALAAAEQLITGR